MIVDVGDPGYGLAPPMFNRGSKKIGSNYAIGTTVAKTATYTRGTANTDDDFTVRRGQSWISVTSPTEGVTHVTAWAPNAQGWDIRRQTATVHWVDAQWALPPPAIVPAGQRAVLRTRVTRTSGAAARGWMVHYEVVDGPPATFGTTGATAVDVPVDANGDAAVEVFPQSSAPGSTRILVQIVRAGENSGEPARMVLGQGYSSVTWSAAGLEVRVAGPANAGVDDVLTYQVTVINPGDLPARNVVLTDNPPPIFQYLNSQPSGQPMGDYVQWNLGDIGPRESRVVINNVRARQNADVRYCFRASAEGDLTAEGCAQTRIFSSALSLDVTGPETAVVGQEVTYFITARNTGPSPLTNVALVARFDPGLQHAGGQASPIERLIGELQPGQSTQGVAVTFIAAAPGRHCHTVQVTADGGHSAVAQRCLVVTAAQTPPPETPAAELPTFEVRMNGPARLPVGETGLFTVTVRNTSNVAATGVRVQTRFPPALRPVGATENNTATENGQAVAWTVGTIEPGQTITREVQAQGAVAAEGVVSTVVAVSAQGVRETASVTTTVIAPAQPPEQPGPAAPSVPADQQPVVGQLEAKLYTLQNPVTLGQPIRFLIGIRNNRNVSDRNITVTATLPEGVVVQRVTGPGVRERVVGNQIRWDPVQELREQEELRPPFEIEVLPSQAGRVELRVRIESQRLRQPLELVESVDVLAR